MKRRNHILRNWATPGVGGLEGSIPLLDVSTTSGQPSTSDGIQHTSSCPVSQNLVGGRETWGIEHGYVTVMGALKFKLVGGELRFPSLKAVEKLSACELLPTARFLTEKIVDPQFIL